MIPAIIIPNRLGNLIALQALPSNRPDNKIIAILISIIASLQMQKS